MATALRTTRRGTLSIVFSSVLFSGCASLLPASDVALATGRYGEAQRLLEADAATSQRNTPALYRLCSLYYAVKNYGKLFPCLDEFEASIARGDFALGR